MLSGESAPLMSGGAKPNRPGFLGLFNGVYVANTISCWSPPGPVTSDVLVSALCGEGSPPEVLRILTRSRSSSAAPRRYGSGFLSFGRTGFALLVFPMLNLDISSPSKSKLASDTFRLTRERLTVYRKQNRSRKSHIPLV